MDLDRPINDIPDADYIHHDPAWFRAALAAPQEDRELEVEGAKVHYIRWGNQDPDRPGLLFVHGNGAHARWFSFIAPLLTDRFNVAAIDLPGMGDSHWRDGYTRETFAHAIAAVAFDADLGPKPVIVGHSFGGFVTLITAGLYGDRLGGVMLADFTVRNPEQQREWFLDRDPPRPTRVYPDLKTARGRFRLAPPQDCANRFLLDYIGRHSLTQVKAGPNEGRGDASDAGWTWKFDPFIFDGLRMGGDHAEIYKNMPCKGASFFGLQSKDYEPDNMAYLAKLAPRHGLFTVADAQHHIMLDRPHGFAGAVAGTMAAWQAEGALKA